MKVQSCRPLWLSLSSLAFGISLFVYPQSQTQVGYTLLTADAGTRIPVATALFTCANAEGLPVSEAGVAAVEPILSGRIFVDQAGTETGIALVNPSPHTASSTLILRDRSGNELARQPLSLGPGEHMARFTSQLFSNLPAGFTGSLTFESDQRLGAITLRLAKNAQNEDLYTTLPVVDLSRPSHTNPIVFPQISAGEGYTTQLILINTTSQTVKGQIRFFDDSGGPLELQLQGNVSSQFSYEISPQGTYRVEFDRLSGMADGYAVVAPDPGSSTPHGNAVLRFKQNGSTVTEAGVGETTATTAARIFVDNILTYTGVALANHENRTANVTFTLTDRSGIPLGTETRTLPPGGHLALFAHELFPGLSPNFTGLMEIQSTVPVAPITLKLSINKREDLILTTLSVADLNRPPTATALLFPQIVLGGAFSTRLIFINTEKTKLALGKLSFYQSNGSALILPLGGQSASQFSYYLPEAGGKQFFPGNTVPIDQIKLIDSSADVPSEEIKEVAVNEGNTVRPSLLVFDKTGMPRDDFELSFSSLSQDIATIDPFGNITGKKAGFSTMTISSGGVIKTATITVVGVRVGVAGHTVTGVTQDLARRLYLAATPDHTILRAEDVQQTPEVYAGMTQTPGLRNDLRRQSLFKNPAFLALDQSRGALYVSDGANHVIRKVQPGPDGKVETLAGTGVAGTRDGPANAATFNNPQGVALDSRGNLWIVDSGNHTIRRMNLSSGLVETIAGKAGSKGGEDGNGDAARFSSPIGIALENDVMALPSFLEPSRSPQQVSVVIADTGNGVIRRLKETGEVETIRSSGQNPALRSKSRGRVAQNAGAPLRFNSPTGVAVDPFGNIYVTESNSARVRTILQDGEVATATQAKTFVAPSGVVIIQGGKVVVADSSTLVREISYGEPQITSITPDKINNKGGERVTVKGNNFAPDTVVVIAGVVIPGVEITDTQTITFTVPTAPSGLTNLTVQNRGGLAQKSVLVDPVPLSTLPAGNITTVAGGSTFAGDGSAATSAAFGNPADIAIDAVGNLFIATEQDHRIRRVAAATGIVNTVAGTGRVGSSGDHGPATAAELNFPSGIAIAANGDLFIADSRNNRIRKVSATNGIITTVAGNAEFGFSGDNGPATSARLDFPQGIALDPAGNLFVADTFNNRIRKVDAATGIITTIAGTGQAGFSGDNGPATAAELVPRTGIAIDTAGNLFIADNGNFRVRRVAAATGIITTVAGTGPEGFSGDNRPATATRLSPGALAIDAAGNLFIAESAESPAGSSYRVRRVSVATGIITTTAGTGQPVLSGDNGPATAARLGPAGIAIDASGNLFIADGDAATLFLRPAIRKVDPATGVITTVAGNGQAGFFRVDNVPATSIPLNFPGAIGLDAAGNLFFVESMWIRKVNTATGVINRVAGSFSSPGFSGDNGPATSAQLSFPRGIVVDAAGNILIADTRNNRIRRVDAATGIITTVAGNGEVGFSGDNDPATSARLNFPEGIALDPAGNALIADTQNNRIRRVDAATGIITTVAGNGERGVSGDRGPATSAQLTEPQAIGLDAAGNLFIADFSSRIRKVNATTGVITTVVGNGEFGFSGDGGPATAAQISPSSGIAVDSAGNLFFVDSDRIRAVRGPIP